MSARVACWPAAEPRASAHERTRTRRSLEVEAGLAALSSMSAQWCAAEERAPGRGHAMPVPLSLGGACGWGESGADSEGARRAKHAQRLRAG
mmetsp:Transcript_47985/g.113631  ORF Transcript_47985/g.113631 Transcript_47985/m.113631 type:complete len:92 (-) Transcript_47985:35-310(-)